MQNHWDVSFLPPLSLSSRKELQTHSMEAYGSRWAYYLKPHTGLHLFLVHVISAHSMGAGALGAVRGTPS